VVGLLVVIGATTGFQQDDEQAAQQRFRQRYLEKYVQLTELTLQRDKQVNEKVPGTIPEIVVSVHQQRVDAARKMLQAATSSEDSNEFSMYLEIAHSAATATDAEWKRWQVVHQRQPAAIAERDVERFRVIAEMAEIVYQEGLTLRGAPLAERNRWTIGLLFDELGRLNDKVENSSLYDSYRARLVFPIR
jgi:hypothetical protein